MQFINSSFPLSFPPAVSEKHNILPTLTLNLGGLQSSLVSYVIAQTRMEELKAQAGKQERGGRRNMQIQIRFSRYGLFSRPIQYQFYFPGRKESVCILPSAIFNKFKPESEILKERSNSFPKDLRSASLVSISSLRTTLMTKTGNKHPLQGRP